VPGPGLARQPMSDAETLSPGAHLTESMVLHRMRGARLLKRTYELRLEFSGRLFRMRHA
jgi:hypothetical protein